jgi:CDP-diacylglycerol--glycerol-3-phosphate 3-phosphatidyltransferase
MNFRNFLPNFLTLVRVLIVPVLVVFFVQGSTFSRYFATGLFIFAAITDFVDGYLARRWKVTSTFGALMDPLADKLLVMAALVMLVDAQMPLTARSVLPGWMAVMILAREIWITGLRGWAATMGDVMSASWSGKVKTALQLVAIPLVALYEFEFSVGEVVLSLHLIGLELLLISIVVSYWGAIEYTLKVFERAQESCSNLQR